MNGAPTVTERHAETPDGAPAARSRRWLLGALDRGEPGHAFVHLFYSDLWPDLARYLGRLPRGCRIAVNLVEGHSDAIAPAISAAFPSARVLVSPNRGRDIGGFLRLQATMAPGDAEPVWLVHSKRSPHMENDFGGRWRRELLEPILGSRHRAAGIARRMARDPSLGIVAARRWRRHNIGVNQPYYEAYLDRLGIAPEFRDCDFVGGTMMVLRAGILREIAQLVDADTLEDGDRLELAAHTDGQRAHAIERVIFNLARQRGYRIHWKR